MRIETWYGHDIRFLYFNGEWYAVLKDICDAVGISTRDARDRINPDDMIKESVEVSDVAITHNRYVGENERRQMLLVNEFGIYNVLFTSRKLEAKKFRRWVFEFLRNIRQASDMEVYDIPYMSDVNTHNITIKYTGSPRHYGKHKIN